jgi:uncharacterized protein (DUF58 family)
MTLKQKAIIRAMCVFGVAALSAIIVNVILHFVPAVTIGTIFVAGVACFLFYVCYSISLGQLEAEESIAKMSQKFQETK